MIEEGADGQPSAPLRLGSVIDEGRHEGGNLGRDLFRRLVDGAVRRAADPRQDAGRGPPTSSPGTAESAPENPALLLKAGWTTLISVFVCLGLWALMHSGLSLDDIPFLPRFSS